MSRSQAEQLGREVLAPVLASFARWIHEQAVADGRSHLVFLARDGYAVQMAYRLVVPEHEQIPNTYVYASRRLLGVPAISRLGQPELGFIMGDHVTMSVEQYLRRIGLDPLECADQVRACGFSDIKQLVTSGRLSMLERLLMELEPRIVAQAGRERRLLLEYLHSVCDWSEAVGMIDAGWHGSLQRMLCGLLEDAQVRGYYFGLEPGTNLTTYPKRAFVLADAPADWRLYRATVRQSMEVIEILFAETNGSVVGLERRDGRIVPVREDDAVQRERAGVVETIQRAAFDELRSNAEVRTMSRPEALARLEGLLSHPTLAQAEVLGDMVHREGVGEYGRLYALARPRHSWLGYAVRPHRLVHDLRQSWWRRGFVRRLRG